MLKILILLIAVILIAATGWWFFGHHQERAMTAWLDDNEQLPQNQLHQIEFDTSKAGEYEFACGMNMFHGKVIVK